MSHIECPKCGGELEDVGCYKYDCPNDCFPLAMELWQMENTEEDEDY